MLENLAVNDVRVVNFALTAIAVVVTCLRLWDRSRTARLWWDDAWAAITMLFLVTFMAAVEVHVQDPARHSMNVKLTVAYMCAQFFYAVTWSARVSILLTVIRLSFGRFRKLLVWTGMGFVVLWLILFSQIWWVCEGNPNWKKSNNPQCPLGIDVAVAQVITDVACDAILILAPLRLAWKTNLSRAQKIRIMAIFSTTFITTAISMNHVYFVLKTGGLPEALAAVLQCSVSLIVANLSVIIAFFFRITTEEQETAPLVTMGATTLSFFSFNRRPAVPITSTFMTDGGKVRERKDIFKTDEYALETTLTTSPEFKVSHRQYDVEGARPTLSTQDSESASV
ncbi:hypothetical protein B0H34DRAFT_670777 [Crassisporium funariophilum]|nr:hypothetical protein B0H34DRAFT_670777 [Crassisporium funariophilum]